MVSVNRWPIHADRVDTALILDLEHGANRLHFSVNTRICRKFGQVASSFLEEYLKKPIQRIADYNEL